MNRIYIYVLIAVMALFCQCGEHKTSEDGGSDYPTKETFAIIDSCMSYMYAEPGKAHNLLDSVRDAGLMTRQRCDYFHAMVIFSGENNLDSALAICDRLLDDGVFGDDAYLEEEICVLASDIASGSKRHIKTLEYANRGIAICHGNDEMRGDEALLLGRIGAAEQGLGRVDQARKIYDKAYSLLQINNSFGDFIALISLRKKQVGLFLDMKDYGKAIDVCHEILADVERFDSDPSFIDQRPETMKESGSATHEFADFYQCQIYAWIARAYRMKMEQGMSSNAKADTDSLKAYVEKWSKTQASQSPENLAFSFHEIYLSGRKDDFAKAKTAIEEIHKGDSLVGEYVDYLTIMADEASSRNDLTASNFYLKRAIALSDSVRQHEMMRELSQQMSLNMVQEQQLARQDAENKLARHQIVIILLIAVMVVMFIAGIIILILVRRNRESEQIIEQTQHNLTESKEEIQELVQQLDEAKAERMVNNYKILYERIEQIVGEEKLYLNPDLDIRMLAEAVGSSRSQVSACINSITGKAFRQWISEYRLSLFVKMLKDNPDESIDILMMRCGYKEQSTFRRQFKAAYGVTAGEYRKQWMDSN